MSAAELQKAGFTGCILDQNSTGFKTALHRESASSERIPALVGFPASTNDVSIAIRYANESNLKVAVKCGGHHFSSANSVENGLVIDMGALKDVSSNKDRKSVKCGGGCLWGDVYTTLAKENLVCVGGGVHVVGIGGHLTGGGYGPITWKHGMACDNIIEAIVVVADGQALKVSETINADLFFAIKGGSSAFGVVTEFVLRTFPYDGPYFFRSLAFPAGVRHALFDQFREYYEATKTSRAILGFLAFARGPPPQYEPLVVLNLFGFGHPDGFKDVFEKFLVVGAPVQDVSTPCSTLVEFSHTLDDQLLLGGPRKASASNPITNLHPGLPEDIWDRWVRYTDTYPDAMHTKVLLEFHKTRRHQPQNSCLPVNVPRHGMFVVIEEHHEPDGDHRAELWTHELSLVARGYEKKWGGQDLGVNGNGCMFIEKSEDVWGENYPRLRKIKAKYDPTGVFNRYFPIEPDFEKSHL